MNVTREELYYNIALSFVTGIGPKMTHTLLQHFGSAKEILTATVKELTGIDGMGVVKAQACKDPLIFARAEKELHFVEENNINVCLPGTGAYPQRLSDCSDAPPICYYKGSAGFNAEKIVAIVGTRKNTDYGQRLCNDLIEGLSNERDLLIVSGLAHGIDTIAHKASVKHSVPTIAVLAHGLDTVYPSANKTLAADMLHTGGLFTEFPSGTKIEKGNFPARNRIVAGMSDVTVVVESDIKGGALITAHVANSYNREVAAFPGRAYDNKSSGTNELIRKNVASIITSAADLLEMMGWAKAKQKKAVQPSLFLNLSPEEKLVTDLLQAKDSTHADELLYHTGWNSSVLAATLLQLEMQGVVKSLPGKLYRMN